MNTNTITTILQAGEEAVHTIQNLGPELFTVLACLAVGYGIRLIPFVNNNWIPAFLIFVAGPVIYCSVVDPDWDSFIDMRWPIVKHIILGMIFGLASWIVHKAFLKDSWIENKLFNGRQTTKQIPDSAGD
jgi:hypothetical protein